MSFQKFEVTILPEYEGQKLTPYTEEEFKSILEDTIINGTYLVKEIKED